jgi:hypothetical protein
MITCPNCSNTHIINTDEDPGLRIESFAVINLRGVSTNKTIIYFIAMQTYKELITVSLRRQDTKWCLQGVNVLFVVLFTNYCL